MSFNFDFYYSQVIFSRKNLQVYQGVATTPLLWSESLYWSHKKYSPILVEKLGKFRRTFGLVALNHWTTHSVGPRRGTTVRLLRTLWQHMNTYMHIYIRMHIRAYTFAYVRTWFVLHWYGTTCIRSCRNLGMPTCFCAWLYITETPTQTCTHTCMTAHMETNGQKHVILRMPSAKGQWERQCVCVCVCVTEREERAPKSEWVSDMCVYVYVFV